MRKFVVACPSNDATNSVAKLFLSHRSERYGVERDLLRLVLVEDWCCVHDLHRAGRWLWLFLPKRKRDEVFTRLRFPWVACQPVFLAVDQERTRVALVLAVRALLRLKIHPKCSRHVLLFVFVFHRLGLRFFSGVASVAGRIWSRVWLTAHVADLRRLYGLRCWGCRVAVVVLVGGDAEDSGQGVATGVGEGGALSLWVVLGEEDVHGGFDGFSALRLDEDGLELSALDRELDECQSCLLERFFDSF